MAGRAERAGVAAGGAAKVAAKGAARGDSGEDGNFTNYLLKIELRDVAPAVARLMVVPADSSLWFVHSMIQVVMGWHDKHQYGFDFGGTWYVDDPEGPDDGLPALRHTLLQAVERHGSSFVYMYDFGDGWEHRVTVLDRDYPRPVAALPVECLDGCGSCPPEDVGGPMGYLELLYAITDRNHPEHQDMKEWLASLPDYGPRFDPTKFDPRKVNRRLADLLSRAPATRARA